MLAEVFIFLLGIIFGGALYDLYAKANIKQYTPKKKSIRSRRNSD